MGQWVAEASRITLTSREIKGPAGLGNVILNNACRNHCVSTASSTQSNMSLCSVYQRFRPLPIGRSAEYIGDTLEAALFQADPVTRARWLSAYFYQLTTTTTTISTDRPVHEQR
jgi:hypothetical protein